MDRALQAIGMDAAAIVQFHDQALLVPATERAAAGDGTVWRWIAANHHHNRLLWDEEDRARRRGAPAATIAAGKRRIDQYNQRRNDAVEALDEALLAALAARGVQPAPDARLSSETAGAMIDRLSILALKIYHMRQQSERRAAGPVHMDSCRAKLERLLAQRADLADCLDRLLRETAAGQARFKVYRQFKMYNDPSLNPWLYESGGDSGSAAGGAAP